MNSIRLQLLLSSFMLLMAYSLFAQDLKYDRAYFQAFPDYRIISSNYYASHPDQSQNENYYLHFEKRPEGWFILKKKYGISKEGFDHKQIWDAKKQEYLFEIAKNHSPRKHYKAGDFEYYIYPLYGYKESYQQTIKLFKEIPYKDLENSELEALARAYENEAHGEFRTQDNYALAVYDSTFNPKDIPIKLILEAEKKAWKSIEVYEYLAKKHPTHLSIVGDMKVKLANSYLFHYLVFSGIQQDSIAQKFLQKAKYSKELLAHSKNILKSCPLNSILITYGDNDSYPLWYLQTIKGFRTDVSVMNQMQLMRGRYIYYNKELQTKRKLSMTLDIRHYLMQRNDYCLIQETREELSSFLDRIQQSHNYSDSIQNISIPKSLILAKGKQEIELQLNGSYIYKNELALLDIISSNWPKRPFCMVPQSSSTLYNSIYPYLQTQGLVQILQTEKQERTDYYYPALSYKKTEDLFLNTFEWPKVSKQEAFQQKLLPTASNMQLMYYQLIDRKLKKEDIKTAKKLYRSYSKRDIFKQISSGKIHLYLAIVAQKLDLKKKKNQELQAYMQELEDALTKALQKPESAYEHCFPAQSEESIHLKITEAINFCRLQDWDDWVKKYQKKFKH